MLIVLLRHGIAADAKARQSDAERQLTDDGKRQMKSIGRALATLLPEADAIFASPLVRAQQTAECVARAYPERLRIETIEALEPGQDPAGIEEVLDGMRSRCAYFVGHETHLTDVMLALTGMEAEGMALEKGGCYGVEIDRKRSMASLVWMFSPAMLLRIGEMRR